MNTKFNPFTFINPFLSYIDSGKLFRKPFSWLYMAMAGISVLLPFILLFSVINSQVFEYLPAKFIVAFIFIWLFVLAACWVGALIWWNRKDKVHETSPEGAEFPATPVIAHLIQTFGEWFGSSMAIIGFGSSFCALIFLGGEGRELTQITGGLFKLKSIGIWGIFLNPILGFLIVVGFRYLAEMLRALAAIANNTKK